MESKNLTTNQLRTRRHSRLQIFSCPDYVVHVFQIQVAAVVRFVRQFVLNSIFISVYSTMPTISFADQPEKQASGGAQYYL